MEKLLWRCLEIQIHVCVYDFLMILDTLAWWNSIIACASHLWLEDFHRVVCVWRRFTKRANVYKAGSIMQHLPSCVTCVPSYVFDLKVQEKVLLTLACYFETTMECCLAIRRCQGYLKVHRSGWALYLFGSGTLVHYYQGHHDVKRTEAAKNNSRKKEWIRAGRSRGKFPQSQWFHSTWLHS